MAEPVDRPVRIGNCSGFYGDRLSAMREMLEGGPLDVLTGDYLAELTMLILGRDQLKDPSHGYARTFARQLEDCLGLALEKGVRIVSNAGGLNPAGLAARIREAARGLGLDPAVAYVDGDDVRALGFENALTANAYLGGSGIAAALSAGADVVVTGRVTDASLVVGPAVWWHGWSQTSYDELAGAVVAGHVLECGCQATGGNFSGFFHAITPHWPHVPLGFPLAEIAADGSSVITKHDATGGLVSVDTVTAQLMYEIQGPQYLGPDVTTDLTSIRLARAGSDRVAISGVRGSAPPERLKVGVNELGGYRNSVEFLLTGLDIDAKAEWVSDQLRASWGDHPPQTVVWHESPPPVRDAASMEMAHSVLRCTAQDPSPDVVGRLFTGAAVELALSSYPGFTMTAPPRNATPYGVYRAEYVARSAVTHTVHHADGSTSLVEEGALAPVTKPGDLTADPVRGFVTGLRPSSTSGVRVPLGTFVHARSGDKGGDANLGLWVSHDDQDKYDARVSWLLELVTTERVQRLLPETQTLDIEIHQLPNLGGVNVVVHGFLGRGVAASTRIDPQAKALGELARSRFVDIPEPLL